jgi:hypothetical protein
MPLEITYRACLVRAHQCAIARDVSRENCAKTPFHPLFGHFDHACGPSTSLWSIVRSIPKPSQVSMTVSIVTLPTLIGVLLLSDRDGYHIVVASGTSMYGPSLDHGELIASADLPSFSDSLRGILRRPVRSVRPAASSPSFQTQRSHLRHCRACKPRPHHSTPVPLQGRSNKAPRLRNTLQRPALPNNCDGGVRALVG